MGLLPFVSPTSGQAGGGRVLIRVTDSVRDGNISTISIKCMERRGEERDKIKFSVSLSKLRLVLAGLLNYFSRK